MSGERRQLLRHQILVLCRGDEVVAGVGQSGEVHAREEPHSEYLRQGWKPTWDVQLTRLIMPAEVPLLDPHEEGLRLVISTRTEPGEQVLEPELIAGDLRFLGDAGVLSVDGHNMVIYELARFETRTRPAFLGPPLRFT